MERAANEDGRLPVLVPHHHFRRSSLVGLAKDSLKGKGASLSGGSEANRLSGPRRNREDLNVFKWMAFSIGLLMMITGAMLATSSHPTQGTQWGGGTLSGGGIFATVFALYFILRGAKNGA